MLQSARASSKREAKGLLARKYLQFITPLGLLDYVAQYLPRRQFAV